jgi:dTDP-glucose 4,6-dehydratase
VRTIVTGGCGFIGAAVVRAAVERGDLVLNVDRKRKARPVPALAPIAGNERHVRLEANVADGSMMRAVIREFKPDRIFHLVGADNDEPQQAYDSEMGATFAILEAARDLLPRLSDEARSGFKVVTAQRADFDVDDPDKPMTAILAARRTASVFAQAWARAHGIPVSTGVADSVFGPHMSEGALLSRLLKAFAADEVFELDHGGEDTHDYVPLRDFAAGLIQLGEADLPGGVCDFSLGVERRDIDMVHAICVWLDEQAPRRGGSWLDRVTRAGRTRPPLMSAILDPLAADRMIGWRPAGYHDGLLRFLTWAVQAHGLAEAANQPANQPAPVAAG